MPSRRSALIVAGEDCQDPAPSRPRAPEAERAPAAALADVLRDPGIGGFDVTTLLNEPARVINETVEEFFAGRTDDDLLLLHFSCPGVRDEDGEPHFAGVAASRLNRLMDGCRSRRIVLLLDCCDAGTDGGTDGGTDAGVADRLGGRGRTVIAATGSADPPGFTRALTHGLRTGAADRDRDGLITLGELYAYVRDHVRETSAVQSELPIARRGRPATPPEHHVHHHHHIAVPELELPDVPDAAVPAPPTPDRVVLSSPSPAVPGAPMWRRLWRR